MGKCMKVVSVNVGLPRQALSQDKAVMTGIFKERRLNLDGDKQADLSVHGGPDKAVYVYPVEHYDYWRRELPDMDLPFGMFGENLTTEGLLEEAINIGDHFRIGRVELRDENDVTVPDITHLYVRKNYSEADRGTLRRAVQLGALPESWRSYFLHRLEKQA